MHTLITIPTINNHSHKSLLRYFNFRKT